MECLILQTDRSHNNEFEIVGLYDIDLKKNDVLEEKTESEPKLL